MSSPQSFEENSSCPIDCPNRRSQDRQPVLGAGYIFSLIVATLLAFQSLDASYKRVNGEEDIIFATKSPPSTVLVIGLTLIGLGLGIEIDKSIISLNPKELIRGIVDYSQEEDEK